MMEERPLRILLVGDYLDDARLGSAKVSHKLREELSSLGHHCDALFSDALGAVPRGRQVRQLVAPVLAARAIARAMGSVSYDVVDAASAEGLWLGIQKRAGRFRNTAFVCRSNGLEHLNYARMLDDARMGLTTKPFTRRIWYPASRLSQVALAARVADRLLLLNEMDRQYALEHNWHPPGRIDVVSHGVSDRFLQNAPTDEGRGAGMLFCGAWDHVKGIAYLVDAWVRLARRGAGVPLTILGPGVPAERVLAAFPEHVRPHVTVIDRVPEDRVIEEYRRHDALIFPSTYEGFGLVVLEAMSQGLPVIATPVGCAAHLVVPGVTGLVVRPRDGSGLADAVMTLASDHAGRQRLGANGRAAVAGMTWRKTAEQTVDTYVRALAQKS
ncbi:MAG TPA: glycosyltransferase family 4 protein [Vicinamibacterales bacterium]|nr:glycosyltransferase family 4 protein [Vicinamibacterales bacterium]